MDCCEQILMMILNLKTYPKKDAMRLKLILEISSQEIRLMLMMPSLFFNIQHNNSSIDTKFNFIAENII